MFIDQAKIFLKAGDGGRGCRSIYRDKYTRQGIPDGGSGGRGADIIIRTDTNLRTLLDLRYHREFRGAHGAHGSGNNRRGRDAEPIMIRVPVGTVITDAHNGSLLRDLDDAGATLTVCRGGKGGIGNRYRSEATPGEPGEVRTVIFDLKLIADAGVVGFPNAGKSTLISHISNAHPVIAAYPFTTKSPVLGVVGKDEGSFVVADIPGLIAGSSAGRGLGDKFLRHIERTKVLVHLIDMAGYEGRDPLADYRTINLELKNYSPALMSKPQVIAANKMDLEGSAANLARFKKAVRKKIYPISALKEEGLEELIEAIRKKL